MKVDRIEIKNYKGFENCNIDFHPKMNVFIGNNASGKTTILNAISKSAASIVPRVISRNAVSITNEDINYKALFAYIIGHISHFTEDDINFQTFTHAGIVTEDAKLISAKISKDISTVASNFKKKIQVSPITIPIIKFYSANRGSFSYSYSEGIIDIYDISQLETWSNIMQSSLSYGKFSHWFYQNETDELRLQRDYKDFNAQSPALRDVRKALALAFKELGYGDYSLVSKQIKRAGNSKLTPALFLKNNKTLKEENLDKKSDGEKAIITLISDIAYNLSIAKDFAVDNDFLKSSGIVIIDEIETHLHPKWQREILPILLKLFPNIQFFVATHSPQIVASVPSDSVFVCDNFKTEKVSLKTLGEDTNSILVEIFNATDRPKSYIKLIQQFDNLIDNDGNNAPKLEKIISEIKKMYEKDTGSGISDLIDELNIRLSSYKFDKEYEED